MTKRQKRELGILIVVVVVAIIAGSYFRTCSRNEAPSVSHPIMSSPSMPTRIVAKVNGKEILSGEVDKCSRATIGAMEMNDAEIPQKMRDEVRRASLSQIIEEILLEEGAEARGISATDEEVTAFIDSEFRSEFDSEEEFLAHMEADIGLNLEDLKKMVHIWIVREEMLNLFTADLEITEEEIDTELKMYEEMLEGHPGGKVPPPAREEAAESLKHRKAKEKYDLWMDTLIAEAEIEILDPELSASKPLGENAFHAHGEASTQDQTERSDPNAQPDDSDE
jgi:FKBP-type peptidyl-prolyl cis-trans isomerase (trigger factor)